MGRFLALLLLCCLAALALTATGRSDAPVAEQPDGLLVLGAVASRDASGAVTREQVVVADPRTGAFRSHRLPGGTLCGGSVLAAGDGVVFSSYRGRRAVARTLPLDLRGRQRSLGREDVMAPIGATGRLVMAAARYTQRRTVLRSQGRRIVLPGWAALEAGVDGGLLVSHNRGLTLRRPGRPHLRLSRAHLLAAGERRFASCTGACGSVRIGRRSLRAPGRLAHWVRGALSPDERRLAVALRTPTGERAAVADLTRGTWTLVPGARLSGYHGLAWSPSGDWLFYTAGDRRLMAWRVGTDRAQRLPIRTGGTVLSIATARRP